MTKRIGQKDDESAMEFLRRVVGWCDHEQESFLDDLPSVDAVLDFFGLWAVYGTDFWTGILECIAEGDDPRKARAFVRKYKLPQSWSEAIDYAIDCRESSPLSAEGTR